MSIHTHTHTKCVVSMNKYCLRKLQRKISDYYECIWQVTCVKMTSFVYDISHCSMWRKLVSFIFKDLPNGYWLIVSVSVCFHFLLCSDFIDWRCHKFDKNSMMHITSRFRLEFHLLLEKTHGNDMANKIHRFDYHAWNWYHIWMHLFVCEDYWPLTFHELVLHVWMIVGRKKSVGIGFFSSHTNKWNEICRKSIHWLFCQLTEIDVCRSIATKNRTLRIFHACPWARRH